MKTYDHFIEINQRAKTEPTYQNFGEYLFGNIQRIELNQNNSYVISLSLIP